MAEEFKLKSHEVLRDAIEKAGVKTVAYELGLSPAMVYKWCQDRSADQTSGARNPLDRVLDILRLTGDTRVLNWLCHRAGGFYVPNPDPSEKREWDLLMETQKLVAHFAGVLKVVTHSIDDDGLITPDETKKIRAEWEELKARVEHFVTACEQGIFDEPKRP